MMKKVHPCDDLGVTLIGGSAVGIFVQSIHPNTVASSAKSLLCGDHILEVSSLDRCNGQWSFVHTGTGLCIHLGSVTLQLKHQSQNCNCCFVF